MLLLISPQENSGIFMAPKAESQLPVLAIIRKPGGAWIIKLSDLNREEPIQRKSPFIDFWLC